MIREQGQVLKQRGHGNRKPARGLPLHWKKKISNLKIFPHAANRSRPFIFSGLLDRNSFKFRIPCTHAEAESSAFCVHTYVNTLSAEDLEHPLTV